jgi:hypothetical protein
MVIFQGGSMPRKTYRSRQQRPKSPPKICKTCKQETRWLGVEGSCWDCTVKAVKNKPPVYIELPEEDGGDDKSSLDD